ncbi:hypothetical protein DAPPUDRAFT_337108 [Daphnia pulex]|uniref:Uncharacterized protein n=1 Tax=Daphnia pulex TaxID=6669 RepID=E9I105_DAPPU|nr:hypothetical protein DAPPUDRAFT_337108 [Daphnia pulex]|eukprot:EFX62324.1 hypothetical protein DAPPUDRAFT_337108 [Daphnia pulex]
MSENEVFGNGSSVLKYSFPCCCIVYLRVTEEIKTKYENDVQYKGYLNAKAYQYFLNMEEQRKRVKEERKRQEELELKKTVKSEVCYQTECEVESSGDEQVAKSGCGAKRRFGAASRVQVDNGVIKVLPEPPVNNVSDEENEDISGAGEQDSDPNLAIENSGSDESGGDPGKWTTKAVSTLLDVYQNFKPQFNEPYAVKFHIWKKNFENSRNSGNRNVMFSTLEIN